MTTITVTVGWTKSDMAKGYSSFNGYEPGAEQHTEELTFDVPDTYDHEQVCEAVFYASNSPYALPEGAPAANAHAAIDAIGYRGEGAHYSLRVGDTVTVEGAMYACASIGWVLVEHPIPMPTGPPWDSGFVTKRR